MWFKNIRLYCLNEALKVSPEELEQKLTDQIFHPCSSHDKSKYGWISPLGKEGEMLTHVQGDYIMLCVQKQEKILPTSVINEATDEKVAELEERQGRKIYRKEKRQIRDDVFVSLLPRAFTRNQQTFAYISGKDNLIVVNSSSAPKAEALLSLLRESLGSLKVSLPDANRAPSDVMTRWLKEQHASDHFLIDEDCELYNPTDGSNIVRCKGQDLFSDEIQGHLEAGKQVKNLGVTWNSILSCALGDDLSIKRLKFVGMKQEEANEEIESAAQKFDQEFAVMTLELSGFFKSFFEAFGGLQDPKE
ncbi:MAG: recombination-associated protein RdgC [Gammaproteobacteria bacterium]|jgi:recombination associated protein RdgC|nr:recombination-associated protein RdgC [Gammaproteobacteria bacterium]MDG2337027.1 recombination-associated protein RdgC [Gammaproteobacteria bacterium]